MISASQRALEPSGGDAGKGVEPSMEEILASIRRIISDDQAGKAAKPEPVPPREPESLPESPPEPTLQAEPEAQPEPAPWPEEANDDVLDLADIAQDAPPAAAWPEDDVTFRAIEPEAGAGAPEAGQNLARMAAGGAGAAPPAAANPAERLISAATDASVSTAFNALASTILTNNSRTLEDLVREMLKPMLKVWLDDNLPSLVERLVRAEIERVARGGR